MSKRWWCEETGVCFNCWNWIECCICEDSLFVKHSKELDRKEDTKEDTKEVEGDV